MLFCFYSNAFCVTRYATPTGAAAWADCDSTEDLGTDGCSLATVATNADDDDIVYFREGSYTGNLEPANSGSASHYITFIAYPTETPTITHNAAGNDYVVAIGGRSYLIIDGFTLNGNWTGGYIEGWNTGDYNIIRNNTMLDCMKERYGIQITGGDYNVIRNNVIAHGEVIDTSGYGTDAISIRDNGASDESLYTLIEGNTITGGEHSCILAGSPNTVVRNNTLYNDYNQVANSGYRTGNDKILWENNIIFGDGGEPRDAGNAQGIQLNSQDTIIRHNKIYGVHSWGVSLECYLDDAEGEDVNGNRIYNNVMYKNHDGGINVARNGAGAVMSDNVFKNNIMRLNERTWHISEYSVGYHVQLTMFDWAAGATDYDYIVESTIFANNNFSSYASPEDVIWAQPDTPAQTLAYMETNYAAYIFDNLESVPLFANEDAYDFRLFSESPMINAGANLTTAHGADTDSVTLIVHDAKFFSDGFGVPDVDADYIRIGNSTTVQISSINYGTNTITLASIQTWSDDDPVNLYKDSDGTIVLYGSAPDIGAYEYDGWDNAKGTIAGGGTGTIAGGGTGTVDGTEP